MSLPLYLKLIYITHIAIIQPCRYISSKINTRTNLLHWLWHKAHELHIWIAEIDHTQSDGFLEPLNNYNLPWSLNPEEVDCLFLLESLVLIDGDVIPFTLQLVSDALCISQNLPCGFNLNNGKRELNMHILGGGNDCCLISLVMCGRFHLHKFFCKYASVPDWLSPNIQQFLVFMMLKQLLKYLQFHQYHRREFAIKFLDGHLGFSIWLFGFWLSHSIQVYLKLSALFTITFSALLTGTSTAIQISLFICSHNAWDCIANSSSSSPFPDLYIFYSWKLLLF